MSKTINTSLTIRRPAAEIFRLLTTAAELEQWFAEHAEVDLAGGSYRFWGIHTPDVPAEGRQRLLAYEQGRSLSYVWPVNGNDTEVHFTLEEEEGVTLVKLTTVGNREWEQGHGSMTDFWVASLENLRLHALGHTALLKCDYRREQGRVELNLEIAEDPARVWQGLTDPAELDRFFASGARVELQPGGVFSYGWQAGGPQQVVSVEPAQSLEVSWQWGGEPETRVRWELNGSTGRTRLNLVHSGFGERKSQDYYAGWTSFLVTLKAMLELGDAWTKIETDGYVPEGATA
ncbi:MAG: SRPBCC domain-containing protein [bacterium]